MARNQLQSLANVISSGFLSGHLPKVPGTWGSIAYLVLWWVLKSYLAVSDTILISGTIILSLLSIPVSLSWARGNPERVRKVNDTESYGV